MRGERVLALQVVRESYLESKVRVDREEFRD